ncbi:MAG: hypothetical protein ACYDD5_00270 [Sulfuricurvum sp.]
MSVLQELKDTLKMGSRGNKYKVMLAAPMGPTDDFIVNTLAKGGAIPAKTVGTIDVWSQGRKLVIAGDAAYENTWNLTFYNTQDHALRTGFDKWMLFIDSIDSHSRGASEHSAYMAEGAQIQQLSTTDNSVTATYNFYNLWPTSISAIDMADDQQDTVTEFSVDFAYSYWQRTDA